MNPKMKVGEAIMEPIIVHNLFKTKQERTSRLHSLLDQVGLLKNMLVDIHMNLVEDSVRGLV